MTPYEQYFMPDQNLREPKPESDFTPDPLPSTSSRTISLHSAYSVHGWEFFDGRKVWYEAELELAFARLAKMRPGMKHIFEQPRAITYVDDTGKQHSHTFDFLLVGTSLTRWLVAVKPAGRVKETGIDRIVELAAEQIPPSVADFVVLFTDQQLSDVDLYNAEAIQQALRDPLPADDAAVAKVIRKLKGETAIGEIVDAVDLGGYGFDAVVRGVAAGKLRLVEYGKLDFETIVTRRRGKGA
jgi:hypothetical protein